MCDPNSTVEDGRWYTLQEANKREDELLVSMPTGKLWYWISREGNPVVFGKTTKSQPPTNKSNDKEF